MSAVVVETFYGRRKVAASFSVFESGRSLND